MSAGSRPSFMLADVFDACILGNVFLFIRISINNSDLSSILNLHLIIRNVIFFYCWKTANPFSLNHIRAIFMCWPRSVSNVVMSFFFFFFKRQWCWILWFGNLAWWIKTAHHGDLLGPNMVGWFNYNPIVNAGEPWFRQHQDPTAR